MLQVSLGEAHTLVLDNDGQIYSFEWGDLGQLGFPTNTKEFIINKVEVGKGERVREIAAGAVFSCAITTNGELYTWGSGQNGQLGIGVLLSLIHI